MTGGYIDADRKQVVNVNLGEFALDDDQLRRPRLQLRRLSLDGAHKAA
ncbi:hypothetical protein ACMHYB_32615 [Sorangium sp. So ce1128]